VIDDNEFGNVFTNSPVREAVSVDEFNSLKVQVLDLKNLMVRKRSRSMR
jgi:hypothetical protein